jgi:hypothetical protein
MYLLHWQGNSIRGPATESLGRFLRQNATLKRYYSVHHCVAVIIMCAIKALLRQQSSELELTELVSYLT